MQRLRLLRLVSRTPQQKALIVQHVSCHVGTNTGSLATATLLTRKGQIFPQRRTLLVPFPTNANRWAINSPVMHLLEPGERAVVAFGITASTDAWSAECSISGRLLQP